MTQPLQLRLGFSQPLTRVALHLTLSGATVLVDTAQSAASEVLSYLRACGANPTVSDIGNINVRVADLTSFRRLPPQVTVDTDPNAATLLEWSVNPPDDGSPAELSVGTDGHMYLSWHVDGQRISRILPGAACAALAAIDLPFIATSAGFDAIRTHTTLPLVIGRAGMNLDRHIEIATTKPQLVESSGIPGLFRIDSTHLGVAAAYSPQVRATPGVLCDESIVEPAAKPLSRLSGLPIELSTHARHDLGELVRHLRQGQARAVVWDSGLGRRVFTLAALDLLDAWPALVVCHPSAVWVWQRHLDMLRRIGSLTDIGADAHIVTYRDLPRRANLGSPQSIIVDGLPELADEVLPVTREALRRLDGMMDAPRISVSSSWPDDPQRSENLMSVLRPGEFTDVTPITVRYPAPSGRRAIEHAAAYISRRSTFGTTTATGEFRRSSVVTLDAPDWQLRLLQQIRGAKELPAAGALTASLEVVTFGTGSHMSPKIPAAMRHVAAASGRVAVLSRSRAALEMLQALLPGRCTALVHSIDREPGGEVDVALVYFDLDLPDLHQYTNVLLMDYPWTNSLIERSVGRARDDDGPGVTTILHLAGTVDDRISILAARRADTAGDGRTGPPDMTEIEYLLSPR